MGRTKPSKVKPWYQKNGLSFHFWGKEVSSSKRVCCILILLAEDPTYLPIKSIDFSSCFFVNYFSDTFLLHFGSWISVNVNVWAGQFFNESVFILKLF